MKVAVMGCVVNGPGESKHSNIGISLPGTFEEPKAPVYVDGRLMTTLKGDRIVAEFIGILNDYVEPSGTGRGPAPLPSLAAAREPPEVPRIGVALREHQRLRHTSGGRSAAV